MKKYFITLLLAGLTLATLFADDKIVMNGSTTVYPIAQAAAEVFTSARVSVQGTGSGNGIQALIDNNCDIANSSREMKKEEIETAKSKGINPVATIIAKDGIAVIVHPKNKVKNLTLSQIHDIYTGKIKNWKELGGADMEVVAVSRETSSGTFEVFDHFIMKKDKLDEHALMGATNNAVRTMVSQAAGAIGYIGIGYINNKVKALTIEGKVVSEKTVLDGTYPISRPLFMYTNGEPKGKVKDFIDFILSANGQKIVKEQGFVPLR